MRKRERENPCGVCGHYHKYEEGEVCSICGHRIPVGSEKTSIQVSAFPSVILPEFLYLGSYDNASRSELLKTQGISRILNVRGLWLFLFFWICDWIWHVATSMFQWSYSYACLDVFCWSVGMNADRLNVLGLLFWVIKLLLCCLGFSNNWAIVGVFV